MSTTSSTTSSNLNRTPRRDINPRPYQNQRMMTSMTPFDNQLSNHVLFTNPRFNEISLSTLESENAIRNKLNFKYIDLQLIRLITSNESSANVYSKKKGQGQLSTMKFTRLILARVCSSLDDNSRLVYIMEARNQNANLWSKNINHRDSGAISVGSFIRFPSPMPITQYMRCDIPMIFSPLPAVLLKTPQMITTGINQEIESNTSLGFVFNNVNLSVNYSSIIKTSCSGNLCDRQRVNDWLGVKGCGCYGMSPNSSSLVIQHALSMTTSQNGQMNMLDFSSLKFSKLYLNGDIPGSCKLYMLQLTECSMKLFESIDDCIELINSHGGFCVVGWYKRGQITDKSMITAITLNSSTNSTYNTNPEPVHVDSGDISHHIVQIMPHNHDFLDKSTELGIQLNDLKFDVLNIENQP